LAGALFFRRDLSSNAPRHSLEHPVGERKDCRLCGIDLGMSIAGLDSREAPRKSRKRCRKKQLSGGFAPDALS
jgi:hypothetical protein